MRQRVWPRCPRYLVGEDGVIVGPRGWPLKPWVTDNGYQQVHVMIDGQRRGVTVHIIVCETFHGPRPDGQEVAHGNGDQLDCAAVNLSWKTRPANHADKIAHGTAQRGETANNRKLTEAQVRAIRDGSAGGRSNYSLAKEYRMSINQIGRIVRREAWAHI
jgi:hypothetical protein